MVSRILEITFVSVVLYLVLANSSGFGTVTESIAAAYVGSVKALQGR